MSSNFEHIVFEQAGGVAKITLNQPPFNWMTIAMMREINSALESLLEDQEAKVLVFTGSGKAFSVGVDVADHTADKVEEMIKVFHGMFRLLQKLEIPTLAVLNGAALGGGCELAMACDMIIASERAKIGQPEIKVGVLAPVAAVLLPRLIGRSKALELLLTGEDLRAPDAECIGLVNKVVPPEELEAAAEEFIGKLTGLSGAILRLNKRAVYQGLGLSFADGLAAVEELYLGRLMATEDAHEGLAAFMEKRAPVWKDR
jgi:cyclohexa-1,5-dienecarbonyl-CoA hydratase